MRACRHGGRYSYTTDGGATWSRPKTLAQETDQYAWHYVILYQAGSTLYAYLGRTPIADSTESDGDGINNNGLPINGTFLKRSTDEGHTWQDAPLSVPSKDNLVFSGHPLQRDDGRYVMPYWSSGRENGVLISSDLQTWTLGGHIGGAALVAGENQIGYAQEPLDPQHRKNSLFMVARDQSAGAATSTSTDGGATWTPFEADTDLPSYNIARSYFTTDSNGPYLYIYNAGTDSKNRDILNYKTKRPGAAWNATKLFANGPASDNTGPAGRHGLGQLPHGRRVRAGQVLGRLGVRHHPHQDEQARHLRRTLTPLAERPDPSGVPAGSGCSEVVGTSSLTAGGRPFASAAERVLQLLLGH